MPRSWKSAPCWRASWTLFPSRPSSAATSWVRAGTAYQKSGEICGIKLPAGLKFADRLPEPIFTPTTKAENGHDENMTFAQLADLLGRRNGGAAAGPVAAACSRRPAPTPWRGGSSSPIPSSNSAGTTQGNIVLIDEIFTPDSSRFWKRDDYRPGPGASALTTSSSCAITCWHLPGTGSRRRRSCPTR